MRHSPVKILTIGHSTRPIEEFIDMLRTEGVEVLADVRKIPKSRKNPQFQSQALRESLRTAGIEYRAMPGLGGLRHARADSANAGWRNASFRGYADYMQMAEFDLALRELVELGRAKRVAIMCAEAVPWRCHRSLIADALTARGVEVEHVMGVGKKHTHRMTEFARVEGARVTYP